MLNERFHLLSIINRFTLDEGVFYGSSVEQDSIKLYRKSIEKNGNVIEFIFDSGELEQIKINGEVM